MLPGRWSRTRVFGGIFVGWLLLILEHGGEIYRRRNEAGFAPEVGPMGAFVIFGVLVSIFYVIAVAVALGAVLELRSKHPETTRRQGFGIAAACMGVVLVLCLWSTDGVAQAAFVGLFMTPPLLVAAYSMARGVFDQNAVDAQSEGR